MVPKSAYIQVVLNVRFKLKRHKIWAPLKLRENRQAIANGQILTKLAS